MEEKDLEKLFKEFIKAMNGDEKAEKDFEQDIEDLKEEEFEEGKKKLKKEILDKLDEVKDVLIVVADNQGSMIGGKLDIMNSIVNLVENVYDKLDKKDKKIFKEVIIEKVLDK